MRLHIRSFMRARTTRMVVPLAVLALVVSACSPGGATTGASWMTAVSLGGGAPARLVSLSQDKLQLAVICPSSTSCPGAYIRILTNNQSLFFSNPSGGFLTQSGENCTTVPCPEGGQFTASAGGPSGSVCVSGRDADNPDGSPSNTDTATAYFASSFGLSCIDMLAFHIYDYRENFSCNGCLEVSLRPGNIGGPASVTSVKTP